MLKSISIRKYKNLDSVVLTLDHNNAIIYGVNGVGKTNLCRVLKLLKQWVLLDFFPIESRWPELANSSFLYYFQCEAEVKYLFSYDSVGRIDIEELQLNNKILYRYSHVKQEFLTEQFEMNNLYIPKISDYGSYDVVMPILRLLFNSGNCTSSIKSLFLYIMNMQIIDGVKLCTDDVHVSSLHEVTLLEGFMKSVGMHVHLELREDPSPILMMRTKDCVLEFNSIASTGERAIANLVMTLNQYKACSLLCIDEFDAFYHYQLGKHMLSEVIPGISKQYILTTHNTSFLNLVNYNQVYILNKDGCHHLTELTNRKLVTGLDYEHLFRAGEFDV